MIIPRPSLMPALNCSTRVAPGVNITVEVFPSLGFYGTLGVLVTMHLKQISRLLTLSLVALSLAAQTHTPTIIWSFTDSNGEGAYPLAPVIFDSSGAIYGTTAVGGVAKLGTVFKLTPPSGTGSWTEEILYHFTGVMDGRQPNDIVFGPGDAIYSSTYVGGLNLCYHGCGTIFQLTPASGGGLWNKQTLYDFTGGRTVKAPGMLRSGQMGRCLVRRPAVGLPRVHATKWVAVRSGS